MRRLLLLGLSICACARSEAPVAEGAGVVPACGDRLGSGASTVVERDVIRSGLEDDAIRFGPSDDRLYPSAKRGGGCGDVIYGEPAR